jgi:hypothetical protein
MNEGKKIYDLALLNALLDKKNKFRFMEAIKLHKNWLKEEKDEKIIKIQRDAVYECIINICKKTVPDDIIKNLDKDYVIDCFLSPDEIVFHSNTTIKGLFK